MMLHSNAEHLERMHSDRCRLGALLRLQNEVHWPCQEADERISFTGRQEDFGQLQPQHLAHNIKGALELSRRVPNFLLRGAFLCLAAASRNWCSSRFLCCLCFNCGNGPLQKEPVDFQELLVVRYSVLLVR